MTFNNDPVVIYTPPHMWNKMQTNQFTISDKMDLIFNNARFYDPDNGEKPQENMFNPPLNRFWTYLNVDYLQNNVNIMSRIIGTKGNVFKAISMKSEVDYVYYLKDVKQIWIFGYSILDTEYCKQLLLERIDLVLKNL
jgi:hypothetical protein